LVLLPADSEDYIVVAQKIEELEKYMKENNISLEAPKEEAVIPESETAAEAEGETKLSAPSITEQNLNNSDTVTPDSEPVEVQDVPAEGTTEPTPEPTTVSEPTPAP
jgi:hypothetical protein